MNEIITIKERKSAKFSLVDCPLNIKYPFHIYIVEMTKILARFSSFVMNIWVHFKRKKVCKLGQLCFGISRVQKLSFGPYKFTI